MNQILLILHLFGFGAGIAASIGNFTIGALVQASPGDAPVLRKVSPVLGRIGQAGLGLLWLTGIILIWSRYGGPGNLPPLFWWKFAGVVLITAGVVAMGLMMKQVQAGNRALAARMPLIGAIMAGLMVLIVILAVFAFD